MGPALVKRWLRQPLLHCLLIGLGLYLTEQSFQASSDRPALQQRLVSDENLLIQAALQQGWHRSDLVILRRLGQNLRFLFPGEALDLERAYAMNMHRQDPAVRQRLLILMREQVRSQARRMTPDRDTLSAYLRKRPAVHYDFTQVLLGGADPQAALQELRRRDHRPERAADYSQPFFAGNRFRYHSQHQTTQLFGPDFASRLAELPRGQWAGPVASAYGWHAIWLHGVDRQSRPQSRRQALADWQLDAEQQHMASKLATLRRTAAENHR